MTLVVVLADPPREGLVLPRLAATSPLSEAEAADCYAAMLADTVAAADDSGAEVLVNYRDDDSLPDDFVDPDGSAEAAVREVVERAADDPDEIRFEVQVGTTRDGRIGNTVTHLLRDEERTSVLVLDGTAPMVGRKDIDGASMKLRSSDVVVGPAADGRVWTAAFCEPIDFEGAYATPAVETLVDRATDAGHDVDFVPTYRTVETGDDLVDVVSLVRARARAGRILPDHTASFVQEHGLAVTDGDDGPELVRD